MIIIVLTSAFLFVTIAVIICYILFFSNKQRTRERMKNISLIGISSFDDEVDQENTSNKKVKNNAKSYIVFSSYFMKKKKKLSQAYILMKPEEFLLISIFSGFALFLLLFMLTGLVAIGILGFVIGFVIPDFYIDSIKKKRGKKLNKQLPEALDVISNGLKAGLSFSQAMNISGKELESPISDEFLKVVRDNTLGKTMDDSLLDLSQRNDDEDLDMFVTAMIIQRQVGGNLSEMLDTISNTIRERVRIRGEINTLTSQSKLSAVIIAMLPIGLTLVMSIINPSYMSKLFTTTIGLLLTGVASFLIVVGIFVLIKLVKIEI
ncbi:MAG: type II secretion system F family protein [Clostridiaceae bacterium]